LIFFVERIASVQVCDARNAK